MNIYINDLASFLPGKPVDNDHIEEVLGKVGDIPSRTKRRILANNKIIHRYYAIDPEMVNRPTATLNSPPKQYDDSSPLPDSLPIS